MKLLFALLVVCCLASVVSPLRIARPRPWIRRAFWTRWLDRDDPSGTGDWELYSQFKSPPCGRGYRPSRAQCRLVRTKRPWYTGGNKILSNRCTAKGISCWNKRQPWYRKCKDYEIRFLCIRVHTIASRYWTRWLDRDNPSATGDWELYSQFRKRPCRAGYNPVGAICRLVHGKRPWYTGGNYIPRGCTARGIYCLNSQQRRARNKRCRDYEIRFLCAKPTSRTG